MNKHFLTKIFSMMIFFVLCSSYSTNIYSNILNNKNINHHLIHLEHISKAHGQCLTQLQKRLLEVEQEIDYLRGKIQENEYKLSKIIDNQDYIIKRIDLFTNANLDKMEKKTIADRQSQNNNSLNIEDNQHFIAYNKSVNLVLEKKQYEKAIHAFQEFILKYPHSPYQSNAHYWLGQLYYRLGNKNKASYYFALVAKNYPKSSKSPDSLLKVGIIMEENGHKNQAQMIYKQVNYLYPNTSAAKQSQKRLNNCFQQK